MTLIYIDNLADIENYFIDINILKYVINGRMKRMDLVVFKRDVFFADNHSDIVFKKGKEYEILSEDKEFIYVNSKFKAKDK